MNLSRFEPWSLAGALRAGPSPSRLRHLGVSRRDNNGTGTADWLPAVDIVEENECFVVRADLPGVDPQDIEIQAASGTLSLSGKRQREQTDEDRGSQRRERFSGKFMRRFTLPEIADVDAISASSKNGTLEITIPKQKIDSRRIEVEAA